MNPSTQKKVLAIVGGGAAGFFGAISTAEKALEINARLEIHIFESSGSFLKKVKISGGGRCNVTHNLFEVREFCQNYPRGQRELISPMQRFQAKDMIQWFNERGIEIVAEADGRMFPHTNESQTIINCYLERCQELGIQLHTQHPVSTIEKGTEKNWKISFKNKNPVEVDFCLIATGSSPGGYKLAETLGHKISERAPSLFSFKIKDPLIHDLQGLSFNNTQLRLKDAGKKAFKQNGPTLITHWGLSGPAILKLSAWAAREMKRVDYKAELIVNWLGLEISETEDLINDLKSQNSKSLLKNVYPEALPKRFWLNLLNKLSIPLDKQWANLSKKEFSLIVSQLSQCTFQILGQNRFKDEFVECGGVSLKEVQFKTMESKKSPGIYFAGELLDVDGITGGFNFQNAWTTSWIAAQDIAEKSL